MNKLSLYNNIIIFEIKHFCSCRLPQAGIVDRFLNLVYLTVLICAHSHIRQLAVQFIFFVITLMLLNIVMGRDSHSYDLQFFCLSCSQCETQTIL